MALIAVSDTCIVLIMTTRIGIWSVQTEYVEISVFI